MTEEIEVEIVGRTPADEGQFAAALELALRTTVPGAHAERRKRSNETLDLGAVVGIVFGSAAAAAVGRGISTWLAKRQGAEINLKDKTGNVIAKGLTSSDAVRIAEIFSSRFSREVD